LRLLDQFGALGRWPSDHLNSLVNLTHCWENYLEKVKPRLIVTANQWGIEGWLGRVAKKRGVAVLQIMHGVLGGYFYTRTPVISDAMIVPGEFWRSLWPADQQGKIQVFNPEESFPLVGKRLISDKRHLTFFSWPLRSSHFYNFSEFSDWFIKIFKKLLNRAILKYRFVLILKRTDDFISAGKMLVDFRDFI
jgi:hypothetical protein